MELKWIAMIVAWLAGAAMVCTAAIAWGPEGRMTVALMALFICAFLGITTGSINAADVKQAKGRTDG